jgi:hypothetical protein
MAMKNSGDAIGNITRDLPACSAVPRPTAPPRDPFYFKATKKFAKKRGKGRGKAKEENTPKFEYNALYCQFSLLSMLGLLMHETLLLR